MLNLSLEDLKIDFVLSVYENITKQIQQLDLKMSILLSWNGIITVMLIRQVSMIIRAKMVVPLQLVLLAGVIVTLIITAFFCYLTLRPRKGISEKGFVGLLYSGDISNLGPDLTSRMPAYIERLTSIKTHEQIYEQYVQSIVLIADIHQRKNTSFTRALAATAVCFVLLIALIAEMSFKIGM